MNHIESRNSSLAEVATAPAAPVVRGAGESEGLGEAASQDQAQGKGCSLMSRQPCTRPRMEAGKG